MVIHVYICTRKHKVMAKTIKESGRSMVAVRTSTKNKVAKKIIGANITIGEFFDEAANEKLKIESSKLKNSSLKI